MKHIYSVNNIKYLALHHYHLETKVKVGISVRGKDVYIIQSGLG